MVCLSSYSQKVQWKIKDLGGQLATLVSHFQISVSAQKEVIMQLQQYADNNEKDGSHIALNF